MRALGAILGCRICSQRIWMTQEGRIKRNMECKLEICSDYKGVYKDHLNADPRIKGTENWRRGAYRDI